MILGGALTSTSASYPVPARRLRPARMRGPSVEPGSDTFVRCGPACEVDPSLLRAEGGRRAGGFGFEQNAEVDPRAPAVIPTTRGAWRPLVRPKRQRCKCQSPPDFACLASASGWVTMDVMITIGNYELALLSSGYSKSPRAILAHTTLYSEIQAGRKKKVASCF